MFVCRDGLCRSGVFSIISHHHVICYNFYSITSTRYSDATSIPLYHHVICYVHSHKHTSHKYPPMDTLSAKIRNGLMYVVNGSKSNCLLKGLVSGVMGLRFRLG